MRMRMRMRFLVVFIALVAGCARFRFFQNPATQQVTDERLLKDASAAPLVMKEGKVMTDNDEAFLSKVKLIQGAQNSIDLAYYIFNEDYSSSYFSKALIDAARRGVHVRVLVDYAYNYKRLDWYSMMEKLGGEGRGTIQFRFYGRPTKNVLKDAVYLTMGCGQVFSPSTASAKCAKDKFSEIDKLFAAETIGGQSVAGKDISDLNIGNSGLFLSGLYGKNADAMALAVQQGEQIDIAKLKENSGKPSAQDKQNLKKVAKLYVESRTGTLFQKLRAKGDLFFAFFFFGKKLNPLYDSLISIFPVDKKFSEQEKEDWDHFTDFLHHKLILVDQRGVQMGGRNVEDSYHMHPNRLTEKYVFMDTDVYVELEQGGDAIARAFDALWNFDAMVATLDEVRQHAPNDFIANYQNAGETCSKEGDHSEACVNRKIQARGEDLGERIAREKKKMDHNAKIYAADYLPKISRSSWPSFELDREALLAYLENLPFTKDTVPLQRHYGAAVGQEAQNGKYIHDVWLKALPDVCLASSAEHPKQVLLHNAYFYPSSNLTYVLSRMVDGTLDCSHVTVTVLTNSTATTDLNIVNTMAGQALKAFTEFYQKSARPDRSAKFQYYEYRTPPGQDNLSLHSKVSVLGDDIIIGSANADVRSFMMDSNDAMFIRRAPNFVRAYLSFVQGMLDDPNRTTRLNDYFINTPRETMIQEDVKNFGLLMKKYHADKHLDAQEQGQLEARFVEILNDAYRMTLGSIDPGISASEREKNQNEFNEWFQPI